MTKLLMTLTISVVASIMMIGGLIALPDAYSDKKDKGILDECKCEKPHTLLVQFNAPSDSVVPTFTIDVYKKLDDRNDPDKVPLFTFTEVPKTHNDGDTLNVISTLLTGKDKLESNTAFVVYETGGDEPVALLEIHTSCSKPLYKDLIVSNNGYSLKVEDGLSGTAPPMSSIPIGNPEICEDKKSKSTGSITVKKALTNDNGGTATFGDFTITVTNVETTEKFPVTLDLDSGIGVENVPAGTYTLNEIHPNPNEKGTYTTVLIAGDTGCPSMLEETFTIKKNKNLSCTIYNDDNGDGSTGGPGGIIFTNESLQILSDNVPGVDETYASCDTLENGDLKYFDEDENPIHPCIHIVPDNTIQTIAILDPALAQNTRTIVLFSVFEDVLDPVEGAISPGCTLRSILPLNNTELKSTLLETNDLTVVLDCDDIDTTKLINVNYVMIDPSK